MLSGALTPREIIILQRLLAPKGIVTYELVGIESTGQNLPGGLYSGEIEAFYGYVVTATKVYFFWLDWTDEITVDTRGGSYNLGEADDIWQEVAPESTQYYEQIIRAQQRLQQQNEFYLISSSSQPYPRDDISYNKHHLVNISPWKGPAYQQRLKAKIRVKVLFPLTVLEQCKGSIWSARFTHDGNKIVTNVVDEKSQKMQIWQMRSGQMVSELKSLDSDLYNVASDFAFSPDGKRIAVSYWTKRTARVWSIETGFQQLLLRGHIGVIVNIAFSPKGTQILTASQDRTVCLWDAMSGERLSTLRKHQFGDVYATFSPDGTKIATASWDRTICIWETATGNLLQTLQGHADIITGVAFSPDGTKLGTSSWDRTMRLWDVTTGEQLIILRGHLDLVKTGVFSPDSSLMLTYSSDYMPRLWDVVSGKCVAVLEGLDTPQKEASFSPDGKHILTFGAFNEVGYAYLWRVGPIGIGDLVQIFRCMGKAGSRQIIAAQWLDNQHFLLADKGGAHLPPCIYQATLEQND